MSDRIIWINLDAKWIYGSRRWTADACGRQLSSRTPFCTRQLGSFRNRYILDPDRSGSRHDPRGSRLVHRGYRSKKFSGGELTSPMRRLPPFSCLLCNAVAVRWNFRGASTRWIPPPGCTNFEFPLWFTGRISKFCPGIWSGFVVVYARRRLLELFISFDVFSPVHVDAHLCMGLRNPIEIVNVKK